MVLSGVISPLIWVIVTVTRLITPLITTHEPPSKPIQPKTPKLLSSWTANPKL